MKSKVIDEKFLKIVLSIPSASDIRNLITSGTLTKDEINICETIFRNYSILGKSHIENSLIKMGIDSELLKNIKPYSQDEVFNEVGILIEERRKQMNEEIYKLALDNSTYDQFDKQSIDVINRRYKSRIEIEEDNILEELEDFCNLYNKTPEEVLSFCIDYLDENANGIPVGEITSIVSNDKDNRNTYVINLAYNLISKGKNVLFISLNYNKKTTLLNIISRHSCDEKFKKTLSKKELSTTFDEEAYRYVYNDLIDILKEHLVVYDCKNFNVENVFSFQRLIAKADKSFEESSGKKVDVIIVDGIEQLHIDTDRRIITATNYVETEYYSFFKEIAKDRILPIILTNESLQKYNEMLNSGVYYNLSFISPTVIKYSSVILSIKSNVSMEKKKQIEISILKHPTDNLIDALIVKADKNYSLIHYKINYLEEAENMCVLSERIKKEIRELNDYNNKLVEDNIELSSENRKLLFGTPSEKTTEFDEQILNELRL